MNEGVNFSKFEYQEQDIVWQFSTVTLYCDKSAFYDSVKIDPFPQFVSKYHP